MGFLYHLNVQTIQNIYKILYSFFRVILRRLNFICRRFGTLGLFHLHIYLPEKMEHSVPKCRHVKFGPWGTKQNQTEQNIKIKNPWNCYRRINSLSTSKLNTLITFKVLTFLLWETQQRRGGKCMVLGLNNRLKNIQITSVLVLIYCIYIHNKTL